MRAREAEVVGALADVPVGRPQRVADERGLEAPGGGLEGHRLFAGVGAARARPEVVRGDDLGAGAGGPDHRRLDGVGQLPHVPGPRGADEQEPRPLAERRHRQAVLRGGAGAEVLGERDDVFAARVERGHPQLHHREPIVEVLAERLVRHPRGQVDVGRRQDAHVRDLWFISPEGIIRTVLEQLQQLGLGPQAELADLVEEQRPAVGRLDLAGDLAVRRRVRPGQGAEELALDEVVGERGAVQLDERAPAPRAVRRDDARHGALAGARGAGDQHGHVERRHQRGVVQQPPERLAAPDEPLGAAEPRPRRRGRVVLAPGLVGADEAREDRRRVAGEQLGEAAVVGPERRSVRAPLQIQGAKRHGHPDRRAQDGLDAVVADALAPLEARVLHRRGGLDRLAPGDGGGDDAARELVLHGGDVGVGEGVDARPLGRRLVAGVRDADLDVAALRPRDLEHQGQRGLERGRHVVGLPELQQAQEEVTLACHRVHLAHHLRVLHRRGIPGHLDQSSLRCVSLGGPARLIRPLARPGTLLQGLASSAPGSMS